MTTHKIKRRPWKAKDIRELRDGSRRHRHAFDIARRLRRTEGAVRQKAAMLHISLDCSRGD